MTPIKQCIESIERKLGLFAAAKIFTIFIEIEFQTDNSRFSVEKLSCYGDVGSTDVTFKKANKSVQDLNYKYFNIFL